MHGYWSTILIGPSANIWHIFWKSNIDAEKKSNHPEQNMRDLDKLNPLIPILSCSMLMWVAELVADGQIIGSLASLRPWRFHQGKWLSQWLILIHSIVNYDHPVLTMITTTMIDNFCSDHWWFRDIHGVEQCNARNHQFGDGVVPHTHFTWILGWYLWMVSSWVSSTFIVSVLCMEQHAQIITRIHVKSMHICACGEDAGIKPNLRQVSFWKPAINHGLRWPLYLRLTFSIL